MRFRSDSTSFLAVVPPWKHVLSVGCCLAIALVVGCRGSGSPSQPTPDFDASNADIGDASNVDLDDADDANGDPEWQIVTQDWPAAILGIADGPADSVWAVGAQVYERPTVLEWRDDRWTDHELEFDGDLWWVHGFDEGPVFMGGSHGAVFRFDGQNFERMATPALARDTVFGIWGQRPDDLYAVGGIGTRDGFVWHYDGASWTSLPMPPNLPKLDNTATPALFKAWGDGEGTVWFVGAAGLVLRRQGDGPLEVIPTPTDQTLLTVHGSGTRAWAVGGAARGVILELGEEAIDVSPEGSQLFQGLHITESSGWAVGGFGEVWRLTDAEWEQVPGDPELFVESLHAVTVDRSGRFWAVGGNAISPELDRGAILTRGHDEVSAVLPERAPPVTEPVSCPDEVVARGADKSVARRWIEQNLDAIRLEVPEPGVHARNLFHVSLALFDAWAAFDSSQASIVSQEQPRTGTARERETAMSHAAFGVLVHRYRGGVGGERSLACFEEVMRQLGLDPEDRSTQGASAAALGNRVAREIINAYRDDGALEAMGYQAPYMFQNPPLIVDEPGTNGVIDAERWQPLDIARSLTQNGIAVEESVQGYIGPHWGGVTPFALERPTPGAPYFEGELPGFGPEMDDWVVEVIRKTMWLDIRDGQTMDISPGAYGNNPFGSNGGQGHELNPVTGLPYQPQVVLRGDFGRVLAEYWADGPDSETPPGHWNGIATNVFDHPDFERRFGGQGAPVDELTWDVHAFVALNGALHDAAIAAWELKRTFETSRPITLIRWMAAQGQSSDPQGPSFHPDGLPLVEGLIEVVTADSSAPGERHEHLASYRGEIAIRSWPGAPGDLERDSSPATWIRGVMWIPYQPRTFVSPAFPGYVSGHSTFSQAGAEVLTQLTGSAFFPGGLAEFVAKEDEYLEFELGPSTDVRLQWATYQDAADQAGQSRIWGGIHIEPDDFVGRQIGESVGQQAMDRVRQLFERL